MKRLSLVVICALALLSGIEQLARTQTKPDKPQPKQSQSKPKIFAVNTKELEALSYDAGEIKFIASSEDTNGAYAVVELTEMPGYKTAWHQHNNCEEAF
jgi:hypothetical protein